MQYSPLLHETLGQTRVNSFLESVARNSQKSKKVYGNGLFHFHNFLQHQSKHHSLTLESIIEPVQ